MAPIATYRVDDPNVETRLQWTNEVESGGRYIRPIKPIIEATVGSYARTDPALDEDDPMYDEYKGTQPLSTLIADVLDVDEEELQDAYTPDTRFIWSREEWEEALAERVPRYVFYASPGYKAGERKVDYHFVMTQEAFSHASRESREAMLIHGSLVDDDRIFAVMDELERTGSFSLELSLFA